MNSTHETRARLVLAAIETIERLGLARVTVRAITEAAGANVAAINYHFGSKDNLLAAALDETLDHMVGDIHEYIEALPDAPEEACQNLMMYLLQGALRYPNVTRAHVATLFAADAGSVALPKHFDAVIQGVAELVKRRAPQLSKKSRSVRAVQAMSAVLFPAFLPGFFEPAVSLNTPRAQQAYVANVVASLFRPPE